MSTQVPNVRSPKPAINIIKAANLYLVASEPRLSKNVSAAKELVWGTLFRVACFLDENILTFRTINKLMEFSLDREEPTKENTCNVKKNEKLQTISGLEEIMDKNKKLK